MIELKTPYLLFLGDADHSVNAKTGVGIAHFRAENCLAYCKLPDAKITLNNLPELTIKQAKEQGAKTFILGLANSGGFIPKSWLKDILTAIEYGLDIASGMHMKLEEIPEIAIAAKKHNVSLHNVRHHMGSLNTGTGIRKSSTRILTVGTDCSSGKMYTALTLDQELKSRNIKSNFIATGQTGILIAGKGISIDAVPADFISGAVEMTCHDNPQEFDIIEGQGSLYHPSFAGVSLGLLHGSAADYIIMCHDPKREHMRHLPDYPVPNITDAIERNLLMGKLTNPNIKCIGISINSSQMLESETKNYIEKLRAETGLPVTDPCKFGVTEFLENICLN